MIRRLFSLFASGMLVLGSPTGVQAASIYPTPGHETRILQLYDAKLAQWGVPFEQRDVPTRFGKTHLIVSGPEGAPPVLLIHAMGVTATMWQPTAAALSRVYRVYAVDTIGDLGKSQLDSLERYPKDGHGYSLWLQDLLDALHIEKTNLVAASMGGWIAMNFASEMPQRIHKLALLAPLGVNASWEVLFRLSWMVMFPTEGNKKGLTRWVLGDNPVVYDAFGEYMNTALDCRSKLGTPGDLSDETLRKLSMPTLAMFGGKDHPIGEAKKAAQRVKRLMPQAEVEILPESGHLPNIEYPELINARLTRFFGDSSPSSAL